MNQATGSQDMFRLMPGGVLPVPTGKTQQPVHDQIATCRWLDRQPDMERATADQAAGRVFTNLCRAEKVARRAGVGSTIYSAYIRPTGMMATFADD